MELGKTGIIIAGVVVLLILYAISSKASTTGKKGMSDIRTKYGIYASRYALLYGIPYDVVLAVIAQESNGDPNAKGSIGERGLMQMTPAALQDVNARYKLGLSFDDMYDAEKNIQAGTAYLAICKSFFYGDLQKGIQAYNAGMGTVSKNANASIAYFQAVEAKRNLV